MMSSNDLFQILPSDILYSLICSIHCYLYHAIYVVRKNSVLLQSQLANIKTKKR